MASEGLDAPILDTLTTAITKRAIQCVKWLDR